MIAASDGADEFDDHEHETPDPARDGFGVAARDLAAQGYRICGRCVDSHQKTKRKLQLATER